MKSLNELIARLPLIGRPGSILVCETDGFKLSGAVVSRDGEDVRVDLTASSQAMDFRIAVQEVVARLREQQWKGGQAVLLTPGVYSALVELPISPRHKRPVAQMQEMIHWELEPLLIQHASLWDLGHVLQSLGYMTEAQVNEVVDMQQGRRKDAAGAGGYGNAYSGKSFGELAVAQGYVTQPHLDEALQKQAWLHSESEHFNYGWAPQTAGDPERAQDAEDTGIHYWLASGADRDMMRQWETAFSECKVELSHMYPMAGCAVALLDTVDDAILIESHARLVSGIRLQSGLVTASRLQECPRDAELHVCAETYQALVPPEARSIWLSAPPEKAAELNAGLGSVIGREIMVMPASDAVATVGMLGAARDFFRLHGAGRCCGVAVRGPQQPLWQRMEARAVAVGVLLLLTLGVLEVSLQVRHEVASAENEKVGAEKRVFDEAVGKIQQQINAVNKVASELKAREDALARLNAQYDFFAIELPARSAFVQGLLSELANTVSEDIVIDVVEETPNLGFRISAWALNESTAQKFIQAFKSAMYPWGGEVIDPVVREQTGRLGMIGYNIHFRLVETDTAVSPSSAAFE